MQPEENDLERILHLATNDPARRPDFYKALLEASVFVIAPPSDMLPGTRVSTEGETVSIQTWTRTDGSAATPFFTSLAALERAITQKQNYVEMPARALFEMTQGATLVLNPKSDYGKEFFPQEIAALLSNGVNRVPEPYVTPQPSQVLLGQPAVYPTKMAAAVTTLLATRPQARAAYLVQMHDTSRDEKPHLVFGIEADADIEHLIAEVGVVVGDLAAAGEPVDMVGVVRGEPGLSEYFLQHVKPFYERRQGGGLKSLFGLGR